MKKLLLLFILLLITVQTSKAQTVVLDTNGVTLKWTGTTVPSPYFVQANPRGTGMEWFAIVDNSTAFNITNYSRNFQPGRNFFTRPSTTTPVPFDNIITTLVTNMNSLFGNATTFNQPIGSWDVGRVTNMQEMFFSANSFNQPIGSWNVGSVTNMSGMFSSTATFNKPIGSWNVSNVTNMSYMFSNATAFNQAIGSWNVSNVTNMNGMFYVTDFNQPIGSWDVSKVTNMENMFGNASRFNQPIGSWDVSRVTNMMNMFLFATVFNQNIGTWNVSNVTRMDGMFNNSGLSTANYDALLIGWSTITATETALQPNVTFSAGSSKYCSGASARGILTSAPNNWTITDGGVELSCSIILDTNGVTIKYLGISVPSTHLIQASPRGTLEWFAIVNDITESNITNYAKGILSGRNYFTPTGSTTPIPFNNIITTLVTDMGHTFNDATAFNQPIDSWDVSNVTNMTGMFRSANAFNQPIGPWNVSKVINMETMFRSATAFNQPIGSWNVSKVINMTQMFYYATSFNQPIGAWNMSSTINISQMFYNSTVFNQPINSWNVINVTDMSYMFGFATAFNQPIGFWNVSKVIVMRDMFNNSGLSTANYDATLIGWSTISSNETPLRTSVNFNAGISKYCNGASARSILTSAPNNWIITDSGLDCSGLPQVELDTNGVTLKYVRTSVPTPYLIQANPRGTGLEWFAIVDNNTKSNITDYAKGIQSGRTYFTPPGSTTPIPFNNIITTLVTDMSFMFTYSTSTTINNTNFLFNQNISSWDLSSVTNMDNMFSNSIEFNQPIGSWDVSEVTNMKGIFYNAIAFNQPIGSWDVSKVTNMLSMFNRAAAFNQNIGTWNVSSLTNTAYMFRGASSFNQPINSWNVSNVTNMTFMFDVASSFNQPIGSWNVSRVIFMNNMFNNSGLSTPNYDATLIGWSTITASETALQPNVNFNAGTSKYCNGASARNILTSAPNNWTITDSGLNCTSLDTEEFETNTLKLYPNPVVNVLNVKADNDFINLPYTILDGLGRVVLSGQLKEVETPINVEQLSKGIYYIKVADNNSSKFIKL